MNFKKVKHWLPYDHGMDFLDDVMEAKIIDQYSLSDDKKWKPHPFFHKNIYSWAIFAKDEKYYAIGWNENPSIGWGFPIKRIKNIKSFLKIKFDEKG